MNQLIPVIHPQVRVASLLAFGAVLPWVPVAGLWFAGTGLAVLLLASGPRALAVLRGIRRIRWLLLSLAVLYLFFTPGEPLLAMLGRFSPSWQGLRLLVERGTVLVLMLVAALLVIEYTPAGQLTQVLQRMLNPLCRMRLLPARLPLRLGLLFHELADTEQQVRQVRSAEGDFATRASRLWLAVERRAGEDLDETAAANETLASVPPAQWLLPAGILAGGLYLIFPV